MVKIKKNAILNELLPNLIMNAIIIWIKLF